ncbi:MAG: hypothetical protein AAGB93_16165 [Planctomycetota bacterium]
MSEDRDDATRSPHPSARPGAQVTESGKPAASTRYAELRDLLTGDVDALVESLVGGHPVDFATECREYVERAAYLVDARRVAARAIARVAALAGPDADRALRAIDTVVERATADVLRDGERALDVSGLVDDPLDDDPPLAILLARRLGVSLERVREVVPRLNALGYGDRHVVVHCLLHGMSPRQYADRFGDDHGLVQAMVDRVLRLAAGP